MKKIRINFEKFSDGILIPQFPWPNDKNIRCRIDVYYEVRTINGSTRHQTSDQQCTNINNELELNQTEIA